MRAARIGFGPGTVRWLSCAAAAALLVVIVEAAADRPGIPAAAPEARTTPDLRPIPYPPDYRTALAAADRAVATAQARAAGDGGWLAGEMLARAHFERARLTGSYRDHEAAGEALERSFAAAPPGAGPHLLAAAFDLAMHRLAPAEAQLDRIGRYAVPPGSDEQAEIEAMRGDIAFHRGRPGEALRRYDRADRLRPGAGAFRRYSYHAFTGDAGRALDQLRRGERGGGRPSVQLAAWAELQRGVVALDEGRIGRARAHFTRANALFPGYWLIEEHLAETLALAGELDEAERRYRDLAARTGAPEIMDALAGIARRRSDPEEARRWTRRAAGLWQERLHRFPEAAYAEAADHCLAAGQAACALRLARLNYRARPYGEAAALLAEALAAAGRPSQARAIFAALQASRWRSARMRRLALAFGAPS